MPTDPNFAFAASGDLPLLIPFIAAFFAFAPYICGKLIAPRLIWPGAAAGVGGWLGFFILASGFKTAFDFLGFAAAALHVGAIASESGISLAASAAFVQTPELIAFAGSIVSTASLALGRSPKFLILGIAGLWVAGPASALARDYIYSYPLAAAGSVSIFLIVETLYLIFSDRVALTYGTSRGTKFIERARNVLRSGN